ncbi:unnamed protein product, partial [Ectocarpus sp. 13 AM-2016]
AAAPERLRGVPRRRSTRAGPRPPAPASSATTARTRVRSHPEMAAIAVAVTCPSATPSTVTRSHPPVLRRSRPCAAGSVRPPRRPRRRYRVDRWSRAPTAATAGSNGRRTCGQGLSMLPRPAGNWTLTMTQTASLCRKWSRSTGCRASAPVAATGRLRRGRGRARAFVRRRRRTGSPRRRRISPRRSWGARRSTPCCPWPVPSSRGAIVLRANICYCPIHPSWMNTLSRVKHARVRRWCSDAKKLDL